MGIYANLILISLLVVCVFSMNYRRLDNDRMCKVKSGVLCVKDELIIIATIAKGIARKSSEIEKNIRQTKVLETLNKSVNTQMNYTQFYVPSTYYHQKFFQRNNIDQAFLGELIYEAHDAMIYYYNSISGLFSLKVLSVEKIDESFKKIQDNIREEIICRYRSVLDVYSQQWKSVHQIDRLQFSKQRLCPSCIHNVHSIVITQYLREWMELINDVIINLESKFA